MWKTSVINSKYEVNEQGQVRHKIRQVILKGYITHDGYQRFCMYDENMVRKDQYCHVLIATAFIANPNNYSEINHKNFNKLDNSVSNLEWVTHEQNMEHWRKNQSFYTINEPQVITALNRFQTKILVGQYTLDGKLIKIFPSYTQAGKETGINDGNISLAARGKRHTAGGYIWRDITEGSTTIESESE